MKKTKENSGITLITLVVTIIVLVIISSITIGATIGENGLLAKARDKEYTIKINEKDEEVSVGVTNNFVETNKFNSDYYLKDVSADYIQPWYVAEWEEEDFDNYFTKLKQNHIDTCILQYSTKIELKDSKAYFSEFYFWVSSENEYAEDINNAITSDTSRSSKDTVGNMLKSAQKNNIKVFIGLGNSDSYFDEEFKNETWREEIIDLNNKLSSYLINEYKPTYYNIFEGIYLPFEFYTNSNNYEELYWYEMINEIRIHIKNSEINYLQSIPVMISTYCSQLNNYIITEEQMENGIRNLASALQEGDIICTQDKIATNYNTSFNYNLKYLKTIRNVITQDKLKLQYWINVETFYPIPRPSVDKIEAASIARVKEQIKLASLYADKIVTFSYGHYYFSGVSVTKSIETKKEKEFNNMIEALRKDKIEAKYKNVEIKYFADGSYVPIPQGFYYITGDLQTGVVISDDINDKNISDYDKLNGNQFVWIPIDVTKFKRDKFKFDITLSDTTGTSGYWENKDKEYNKMYDSIIKYEGFYVARYETCIIEDKVRSIAGQYVKNNVTLQDAKNYCNSLYKDNNSVKPHVLYGIEWDSMLNAFIGKTNSYNSSEITYIWLRNSQNFGNYATETEHGVQKLSGDKTMENTQIYNIFDLAGNFWEITQENYENSTDGVLRGRKLLGIWWLYTYLL